MWHAHKNSTDVLRSTRETGAWGESAPACSEGSERGKEGRNRDKLVAAGLAPLSCILLLRSVFF